MNILGTQYSLSNKAFEIYVSGCYGNPHCSGCHNPESWDFNKGRLLNYTYLKGIKDKIIEFDLLVDKIMIFGGEPLDQDHQVLEDFLFELNKMKKEIWLFTRYEKEEIPNFVIKYCDYIKCGRYDINLKTSNNKQFGINLATSNQYIWNTKELLR